MSLTIEFGDDIIDTRDLESYVDEFIDSRENDPDYDPADWDHRLVELANATRDNLPDYRYGEALILGDHFEEYAKQLAEDIGAIDREVGWPACHIDWEAAAEALQGDYQEFEVEGVSYWGR
jgi:hypothetical protein